MCVWVSLCKAYLLEVQHWLSDYNTFSHMLLTTLLTGVEIVFCCKRLTGRLWWKTSSCQKFLQVLLCSFIGFCRLCFVVHVASATSHGQKYWSNSFKSLTSTPTWTVISCLIELFWIECIQIPTRCTTEVL